MHVCIVLLRFVCCCPRLHARHASRADFQELEASTCASDSPVKAHKCILSIRNHAQVVAITRNALYALLAITMRLVILAVSLCIRD
jgi:hypothetical protein